MSDSKTGFVQVPLIGFLGLIFIALKLMGHISWSWLWVLSPFWLPFTVIFLTAFILAIFKRSK